MQFITLVYLDFSGTSLFLKLEITIKSVRLNQKCYRASKNVHFFRVNQIFMDL